MFKFFYLPPGKETSGFLSIIYLLITLPTCAFSRSCLIMNKELILWGQELCEHIGIHAGICLPIILAYVLPKADEVLSRESAVEHNDFRNWGHSRHPGRLEKFPFNNKWFWPEVHWAWVRTTGSHLPKGQQPCRVKGCVSGGTLMNSFSFWRTV